MSARSRRLLMVITQEPTQSLAALHGPGAADACIAGEQQDVVLPLMIARSMVMLDVFAQCAPQGAFAKEMLWGGDEGCGTIVAVWTYRWSAP